VYTARSNSTEYSLLANFEFYYHAHGVDVGFDPEFVSIFSDPGRLRALPQLLRRCPRARVVIVGGDGVSYSAPPRAPYDLSRHDAARARRQTGSRARALLGDDCGQAPALNAGRHCNALNHNAGSVQKVIKFARRITEGCRSRLLARSILAKT
jgi:hypothetical protein